VPGEVVGSGEEDLRCRSLLTVCQRRLGLSEAEDTRLEKYSYKLQDTVATYLMCGGGVNNQIKKGLLLSLRVKYFF